MAIEIKMPALSPTMEEGTLARWLVGEGHAVRSGDLLAEIETDKATMEIEAVDEGVITKLIAREGADRLKVGTVIALLVQGDEEAINGAPPRETGTTASPDLGKETDTISADPLVPTAAPVIPPQAGRVQPNASAFVARLARQQGIDLRGLAGSGVDGRIVKADLLRRPASDSAHLPNASPAPSPPVPADIPQRQEKLPEIRQAIAQGRAVAKQQVPHIYLTQDVCLDALLELRVRLNETLSPRGVKLSINDLLVKALALALVEVPACNASFAGDNLVRYDRVDISVAVAGALVWPVIVDASNLTLSTISNATKDLVLRAREGRLIPEEHCGGTASLSNLGMFGIKQFGAAINPPQAVILAIGAGEWRPCVVDGTPGVATMMSVTGSFDHRAVDGADGARLMASFSRLIEDPRALLV